MASVIFAVGPQNAMLIRHGIRRDHPFLIATIFTICDGLLITLGVIGIGQYISQIDWLKTGIVWLGSAFLFYFAYKSFMSAYHGGKSMDNAGDTPKRGTLIATALAVSLLNPGAIIDTVIIVGSVSSAYPFSEGIAFGLGAQFFSTAFFFLIAMTAQKMAHLLNTPKSWQIIDIVVGIITLLIGAHLLMDWFSNAH